MNKKLKQIVPLCFVIAIVVAVAVIYTILSPVFEEYNNVTTSKTAINVEHQTNKDKYEQSQAELKKEEIQMQSIKQVYETSENSSVENLGVLGTMFEDIIDKARKNGLLIRSIEYDMHPATDPLYANFSDRYNVCELKFFFVGSYSQLRDFLNEMVNNFQYLISISKLNITAFSGNTDYILINMSITLYSKHPSTAK